MKSKSLLAFALSLALAMEALAAPRNEAADLSSEFRAGKASKVTAATFKPVRTTPVKTGEFKVDLVVISFPDCEKPETLAEVKDSLFSLDGGFTIADYYKDYSQGITWPVLDVYPIIYEAPEPLGYYCRYDVRNNLIGYKGDGSARARKLREDALKFVQAKGRLSKKGAYVCYVYCQRVTKDDSILERVLRPHYPPAPTPDELTRGAEDRLKLYKPNVAWADPLWPNSIPQVNYPANGGTLVHEIGHLLGAPDFYHASEEHDGVPGSPCLPWSYGPTGMAYCRYIHNAFLPASAYVKVSQAGDYTLSPRSARYPKSGGAAIPPLGIFIPSVHPHYLFYVEYCKGEKKPVGDPTNHGLLIHVINVTMSSPMMGPPDLCYTYRAGDRDFKAIGRGSPFFKPGDEFDAKSDPAAVLPNLLPAGIAIRNIRFNDDGTCSFALELPKVKVAASELNYSLLPQVEMLEAGEALPTSFRAEMNVRYRGEPLLDEYGFCYGLKKNPTDKTGKLFRLFHRDRYDARIIDLKPGATYYVRAYAKSARGIRYSENELSVTLPAANTIVKGITLLSESDKLIGSWHYRKWYFGMRGGFYVSANPLIAFMALANYYRALPGIAKGKARPGTRAAPAASSPIDLTRVHSNPSDSRPKFRLKEVEELQAHIERLVSACGFRKGDFADDDDEAPSTKKRSSSSRQSARRSSKAKAPSYGANAKWVAKCAAALKIENPEEVFVPCKTEEELKACAEKIRAWIMKSQLVLVVRQNKPPTDDQSVRWPLDIAIIDGIGEGDDEFHVVFPLGKDRSFKTPERGYVTLDKLLHRSSDAMLMFYRP